MSTRAGNNSMLVGCFFFLSLIVFLCVLYTSPGTPPILHKPIRSRKDGASEQHPRDFGGDKSIIPNCECLLSNDNDTDIENKPAKEKVSDHIKPLKGKKLMQHSLTGALWNFKDTSDQQLYLYETLLMKNWTINVTNIDALRTEVTEYHEKLSAEYFVMTQTNVKRQEKIRYVYGTKSKKEVTISSDFYNRLPKTNPFTLTKRFKSCAIVGNSGLLRGSHCGTAIDSNDFVFRCNLATLGPFKEDAGSKSNFTTMNPSIVTRRHGSLANSRYHASFNKALSNYRGYIWVPCLGMPAFFPASYRAVKANKGSDPKVVCGYPTHFEQSLKFWAERSLTRRLSTGFYLVMSAIQVCDELNLFGFWPFLTRYNDKEIDVPYHYFDNETVSKAKKVHSMNDEFSLLLQLHNLGVLRLHGGSCR
ncbi:alpha-N-acetylneuraminate alpha-2,8-sialyltransferase ST8SIA3-like [Diadema antillarum]